MTQTLIEQLEALPRYRPSSGIAGSAYQHSHGKLVLYDDLRAIIEQHKSDHTELISELVEALDDANKKIKKAKAFNYQAEMYISESEYELDGFLGTTAADISVNWQSTIDSNNTLLTKAREAIK